MLKSPRGQSESAGMAGRRFMDEWFLNMCTPRNQPVGPYASSGTGEWGHVGLSENVAAPVPGQTLGMSSTHNAVVSQGGVPISHAGGGAVACSEMLPRPVSQHLERGRQMGKSVNVPDTRAPTQLAVHGHCHFGGGVMLLNEQAPALTMNDEMHIRVPLMLLEQSGVFGKGKHAQEPARPSMQMGTQLDGASGAISYQAQAEAQVYRSGRWSAVEQKTYENACVCHGLVNVQGGCTHPALHKKLATTISCLIGSRSYVQVQKKYATQVQYQLLRAQVQTKYAHQVQCQQLRVKSSVDPTLVDSPSSSIFLDEGIHQPPQLAHSGILSPVLNTGSTLAEKEEHEISVFLDEVNTKPICMAAVRTEEISVVSALIRTSKGNPECGQIANIWDLGGQERDESQPDKVMYHTTCVDAFQTMGDVLVSHPHAANSGLRQLTADPAGTV